MAKYRHEYKYICSSMQRTILKMRMKELLHSDSHTIGDGYYVIRSLYFDTPEDQCYFDNENGVGSRVKYRIRIYNGDKSYISLEKKVKQDQLGYKESCLLTEEECRMLMRGDYTKWTNAYEGNSKVNDSKIIDEKTINKKRLILEMQTLMLRPKVIVEYKRYPFVEKATNVRVTFDEDISSSNAIDLFLEKQVPLRPVNPLGKGILEVKWDGILPDYIRKALQLNDLAWSGYSKYYYCRKFNMYGGVRV